MPLESFVRFDSSSRRKKSSFISNNSSSSSSPASSALQVLDSCKPDANRDSLQSSSSTLHVSCKKNISMTSSKSSLLSTSSRSNIFRKSFATLLIFAIILKDVNRVVSDSRASLVFPALASAAVAAAVSGDRDDDMRASAEGPDGGTGSGAAPLLLNLVNPCAIAAAVFGAPAVPYVIPCTILRRIRLFRETLMPETEPQITSIANLLSNRQKLFLGNLVMGAVSSTSSGSGSSGSIRT